MMFGANQPYLFPYLGYFQLINAVDYFGITDDVQYINRGWIARNQILLNNQPHLFSFSVRKESHRLPIKERFFSDQFDFEKNKFLKTLSFGYSKAPFYEQSLEIIIDVLSYKELNVALFLKNQLELICDYLQIKTFFVDNTLWINDIESKDMDDTQIRLIERIQKLSDNIPFDYYVNLIGGKNIYSKKEFRNHGIKLKFIEMESIKYRQFNNNFVSNLSIIDVMMFNDKKEIQKLLSQYKLV